LLLNSPRFVQFRGRSADEQDILTNPADRDVHDLTHEIVAIGSSSSKEKAEKFAKDVGAKNAKYYDNYEGSPRSPDHR